MAVTDEQLADAGNHLGQVMGRRGCTIITAESCTGGWVAKVLTDRAGSSAYVLGGLVTYSNDAKQALLGVTGKSLDEHGAVNEPVVREMVAGALVATDADVAVAISGVAGPGGGSEDKPVGTVWFAWAVRDGANAVVDTQLEQFSGDRELVREASVAYALQGCRERIAT